MLHSRRRIARNIATIALVSLALLVFAAAGDAATGSLTMGPQAMEGNLVVTPGTILQAGYDFTIPGSHPATTVTFAAPQVVFDGVCTSGGAHVTLTVPMTTQSYADAAGSSSWLPSGDQHSPLVYQGALAVPDLCAGGSIRLAQGGTFTTQVFADVPVPGNGVHVRWHYSADGTSGSWSGTAAVQPTVGSPGASDLAITNSDGTDVLVGGASTTYTIVVTNIGTAAAPAETVTDLQPPNVASFSWTAIASGGASVASSSGTGSISDSVTVPVGGAVTFTLTATGVTGDATSHLVNTAQVGVPPDDPNPSNNTATDSDFVIGF